MNQNWLLENLNYAKGLIDENALPNCLIITGNKSIGKNDLADEISKYYLDRNSKLLLSDNSNYKLIKAEADSKVIKVDQIRDLLDKIYLKSDKRVICIQDAEKLNINSANSLLKIIEEPPLGTKFIITTSKISSIIPTILSRSTVLKCANPHKNDVNTYLNSLDSVDIDNYYVLSNLNSNDVSSSTYKDKFSLINDFFYGIEDVISSSDNIINFSKKFSVYNIEQILNMLLFVIISFQKAKILNNNTKFYKENDNIIKQFNTEKLNFIYDKLIDIKKNIDIIQNNETILFSICLHFKKLSKAA